jgi:nitrate reductase cytochrome c-type subunit
MNRLLRSLVVAGSALILSLPLACPGAETKGIDALAREAEDAPPLIPHQVSEDANGEACLVCHKGGANGAPITPHAMRLNCTQCHVTKLPIDRKPAERKGVSKKR